MTDLPGHAAAASRLVAEAFGVDPELVPLLPGLLEGIDALGGWPDEVVAGLAESAELPQRAAVVDLGCGKGGISIAIAKDLGHEVKGVDVFEPFARAATEAARAASVGHLCTFEVGRIEEIIEGSDLFDVAVFSAVGAGMFGDYAGCIGALRRCVRPAGYLVLCDGFLTDPVPPATLSGYEYYEPHAETLRQLTAHGDSLVRETLVPRQKIARQTMIEMEILRRNARRIAETEPRHGALIDAFLAGQEGEYEFINCATREGVWLLQRA